MDGAHCPLCAVCVAAAGRGQQLGLLACSARAPGGGGKPDFPSLDEGGVSVAGRAPHPPWWGVHSWARTFNNFVQLMFI
jgi:hypothetical protein